MRRSGAVLTLLVLGCTWGCMADGGAAPEAEAAAGGASVLVFSKTDGYRHGSIEAGVEAIRAIGAEDGFAVEATENAAVFTDAGLARFDAVVFLNTTGTLFDDDQRGALRRYVEGGGGWMGVHSAADTEYDWPWYGRLVGAWFESHPRVQEATLTVVQQDHPATRALPSQWERVDEWYSFRSLPGHTDVLLRLDTESFEGSAHPGDHPIAWAHEVGNGRAFYTGLGHTQASYTQDELFLAHVRGGLRWAMGASDGT